MKTARRAASCITLKKYVAKAMKCPHLLKWMVSCEALEGPYVPSMFELEEYCRTRSHMKCPFFRMKAGGRAHLNNHVSATG